MTANTQKSENITHVDISEEDVVNRLAAYRIETEDKRGWDINKLMFDLVILCHTADKSVLEFCWTLLNHASAIKKIDEIGPDSKKFEGQILE